MHHLFVKFIIGCGAACVYTKEITLIQRPFENVIMTWDEFFLHMEKKALREDFMLLKKMITHKAYHRIHANKEKALRKEWLPKAWHSHVIVDHTNKR